MAEECIYHLGTEDFSLQRGKTPARIFLAYNETLYICLQPPPPQPHAHVCTQIKLCMFLLESEENTEPCSYYNSASCHFVFYGWNMTRAGWFTQYSVKIFSSTGIHTGLLHWANWQSAKLCLHLTHGQLHCPKRHTHSCITMQLIEHVLESPQSLG